MIQTCYNKDLDDFCRVPFPEFEWVDPDDNSTRPYQFVFDLKTHEGDEDDMSYTGPTIFHINRQVNDKELAWLTFLIDMHFDVLCRTIRMNWRSMLWNDGECRVDDWNEGDGEGDNNNNNNNNNNGQHGDSELSTLFASRCYGLVNVDPKNYQTMFDVYDFLFRPAVRMVNHHLDQGSSKWWYYNVELSSTSTANANAITTDNTDGDDNPWLTREDLPAIENEAQWLLMLNHTNNTNNTNSWDPLMIRDVVARGWVESTKQMLSSGKPLQCSQMYVYALQCPTVGTRHAMWRLFKNDLHIPVFSQLVLQAAYRQGHLNLLKESGEVIGCQYDKFWIPFCRRLSDATLNEMDSFLVARGSRYQKNYLDTKRYMRLQTLVLKTISVGRLAFLLQHRCPLNVGDIYDLMSEDLDNLIPLFKKALSASQWSQVLKDHYTAKRNDIGIDFDWTRWDSVPNNVDDYPEFTTYHPMIFDREREDDYDEFMYGSQQEEQDEPVDIRSPKLSIRS